MVRSATWQAVPAAILAVLTINAGVLPAEAALETPQAIESARTDATFILATAENGVQVFPRCSLQGEVAAEFSMNCSPGQVASLYTEAPVVLSCIGGSTTEGSLCTVVGEAVIRDVGVPVLDRRCDIWIHPDHTVGITCDDQGELL